MRIAKDYADLLNSKGIPLSMLGISDIALKRDDALQAVSLLRAAEIPILGGDVYFQRGNLIELAYANWYVQLKEKEEKDSYLRRSWDMSEAYIREFPDNNKGDLLFSLVTGQVL
jgi:Immunity protein 40